MKNALGWVLLNIALLCGAYALAMAITGEEFMMPLIAFAASLACAFLAYRRAK